LAHQAGQRTLDFFQSHQLKVDRKADRTPVTEADRAAEQLLRTALTREFPEDEIVGEEFGSSGANRSGYRWIVDPIDGTKSFICGVPLYATLVGLLHDDRPVAGAIAVPGLDELAVAAIGRGAWYRQDSGGAWKAAAVSRRPSLSEGLLCISEVGLFGRRGLARTYERLESAAGITRTWGDGYGYLLVATGRAEAMVDPVVSPWDVAAIGPVLTEAGGQWSDWRGAPRIDTGDFVGTNGLVHLEVMALVGATPTATS
jgi:histidinol phosphatase-like enzyme (inositol monophosphatase family)